MPHRLSKQLRDTFNLAKQFSEYYPNYSDYDIAFKRFELVDHQDYVVSPSHLKHKLFDREAFLKESQRLTKETTGPIYVEFDPHLNPTAHAEYPTKRIRELEKELE